MVLIIHFYDSKLQGCIGKSIPYDRAGVSRIDFEFSLNVRDIRNEFCLQTNEINFT